MPLSGMFLEASVQCPRCRQPMPLNGATESVLCSKCQSPMPTSAEFWKGVIGDELLEIASFDEKEGRTSTKMMAEYGTMQMTYGRLHPRCPKCKADFDDDALLWAASRGKIHCGQCGVPTTVRPPPPWLSAIFPSIALLAAETVAATSAGADADAPTAQPVMIHCIQCGGKLAVDGKERLLRCQYCNGENYLPDAMWLRLHPAQTNEPWFLVFDAAKIQKTLGEEGPNGIEKLSALIGDPAGNLILAYEAEEEGAAGHASRIASLDARGGILWVQDGIEFDYDETSLVPNPQDGTFLLVDKRQHAARVVDPRTGQPLHTIGNPSATSNDDDEPRPKSNVFDPYLHEGLAIDCDGTILVLKEWDDEMSLRRFFPDGSPAPLWPTKPFRFTRSQPEWGSIPACPERLPSGASLTVGCDGFTYFYCESHIAKATRAGRILGVIPVQKALIQTLHAFGVDRQGTAYLLFDHAQEIGGHAYPHVMRFLPDGRSHLWLGPHAAPGTPFLGRYTRTMCVMPDGTLLLGCDAALWRIAPTGAVLWRNALAMKEDECGLADLAKKREPKRVAHDAGG